MFGLSEKELKKRNRILIDIAKANPKETIKDSENVFVWHSNKRNLGPLTENWYKQPDIPAIMWCYKNVTITCKYPGLQSIIENLICKQQQMIFTRSMRQMIVQMDEWDGLTINDIRIMEDECKRKLEELITSSKLSDEYL